MSCWKRAGWSPDLDAVGVDQVDIFGVDLAPEHSCQVPDVVGGDDNVESVGHRSVLRLVAEVSASILGVFTCSPSRWEGIGEPLVAASGFELLCGTVWFAAPSHVGDDFGGGPGAVGQVPSRYFFDGAGGVEVGVGHSGAEHDQVVGSR